MAESTLALSFDDLRRVYAEFLGWGSAITDWSSDTAKTEAVRFDVNSGCRRFYYPAPLQGQVESYNWSFMRPIGSVTLASGESTVDLPDNFGSLEGDVTVASSGANSFFPLHQVGEPTIRALFAEVPSITGRPLKVALLFPSTTSVDRGQRFQLYVYPTADQAYTLNFQYNVLADALTASKPYMLGGAAHAETLLEAVLSVAEERRDDAKGVHWVAFQQCLAASISQDRRAKPQNLGYNRDRSDGPDYPSRRDIYNQSTVTFNGTNY